MFELAFLGLIGVWLCRRRGWGRAELRRAVGGIRRVGRRALGVTSLSGPGLPAQCAADVKNLMEDLVRLLPSRARARLERRVRKSATRPRVGSSGPPTSDAVLAAPGSGGEDGAVARLQRRYIDGRISLDEYVEAARTLRSRSPRAFARPSS